MVRRSDRTKRIKLDQDTTVTNIKSEDNTYHKFINDCEIECFQQSILQWYDANKRELPWRKLALLEDPNKRAYAVWVSEIMLQQTQVATVIDYYNKWMKKWPTLQDLAGASLEEVNEMWSGLGYYSRGRRLHEGAQKVVNQMKGEMPTSADTLLKELPGVGKYTAGAIASIAHNEVTGVVDGNVVRVLSRTRAIGADSTSQHVVDSIWSMANTLVDRTRPGDFNQAMMELGATVCTPKTPQCSQCPIASFCRAFAQVENQKEKSKQRLIKNGKEEEIDTKGGIDKKNVKMIIPDIECANEACRLCLPSTEPWDSSLGVMNYPRKPKKKPPREEKTMVSVIIRNTKKGQKEYFLVQRPEKGLLANMWEFPSMLLEKGDTEKERQVTMDTHLREKFPSINLDSCKKRSYVGEVVHIFSHIHQTYLVETFTVDSQESPIGCCHDNHPSCKWVTEEELGNSAISTSVKKIFKSYESSTGKKTKSSAKRKNGGVDSGAKESKKQLGLEAFFKPQSKKKT
ncbi:adenine DNA glycosylase-like [Glandiceps talaboti]